MIDIEKEIQEFEEREIANNGPVRFSPTQGRLEAWLERGRRDREKINELIKTIPYDSYGDALREGLGHDDAWGCFVNDLEQHFNLARKDGLI